MKNASQVWGSYYETLEQPQNYFPESFVARVFLSKNPVQFLEDDYKDKAILDIGCGHGRNIPFLQSLGFKAEGLEVTQKQVDLLKSRFPKTKFHLGKSSAIPTEDARYDYMLACNSIYYLDDAACTIGSNLQEVARTLKTHGKFIASFIGVQHSILKNCTKLDNSNTIIQNDFLGFRNKTTIRPLWHSEEIKDISQEWFTIHKQGEIIESSEGFTRHLHYFVLEKK